ncbi:MAG: hypothetical protein JWR80_3505 [Bradyrhizobium sp.]|nr:hypothetical protein [Bradyrhizobium sp.]
MTSNVVQISLHPSDVDMFEVLLRHRSAVRAVDSRARLDACVIHRGRAIDHGDAVLMPLDLVVKKARPDAPDHLTRPIAVVDPTSGTLPPGREFRGAASADWPRHWRRRRARLVHFMAIEAASSPKAVTRTTCARFAARRATRIA